MAERPYTLLSCALSLDGYLDSGTGERLLLSNEADLARVDGVRAGCDAILVGATTVRHDDPRLLVRSADLRADRRRSGLPETPTKVTLTRRGDLDPSAAFFTAGGPDKLVYCASGALRRTRRPDRRGGDGDRRRSAGGPGAGERGPAPARRTPSDGGGRRQRAHPVPHRRPGRRAAAGGRAVLRRAIRGRAASWGGDGSRSTPGTGRRWPRCCRSATSCSCATGCPSASRPGPSSWPGPG